jgi:hypothetical protein
MKGKIRMKTLIVLSLFSLVTSVMAKDVNHHCDVLTIHNDNVFEEGLGATGSTAADDDAESVTIKFENDEQTLSIGQHNFSADDNDKMLLEDGPKYTKVTASNSTQSVQVTVYKTSKLGVVLQKDKGEKKYKLVAELDCNNYAQVKKQILKRQGQIKEIKSKLLPENVLNRMNQVDVAFEMGDGYYDVKNERVYSVTIAGKLVGYIMETDLRYTEGDDLTTETYFLKNGVRFSGPGRE